jgi:hypothetical protein
MIMKVIRLHPSVLSRIRIGFFFTAAVSLRVASFWRLFWIFIVSIRFPPNTFQKLDLFQSLMVGTEFLDHLRALQPMMNLGFFYDCSPYVRLQSLKVSQQLKLLTRWGLQPHAQPQTWRARVSFFVWIITFDLSGMGDTTSK